MKMDIRIQRNNCSAKTLPSPQEIEDGEIVGGFAHNQVIALADKVVEAVKGSIRKFL